MTASPLSPSEMKVFFNHIYELKKGVRRMALYTAPNRCREFTVKRLQSQRISFIIREIDGERFNLFFGRPECINAIRMIVDRPLNQLTPEEDFILGAVLGYDICAQCKRFCSRKTKSQSHTSRPNCA